jgi:quercetin dioxygenase-like cupin family protein
MRRDPLSNTSSLRVLLVDGHEVSRAACRALLRTEGVEVVADCAADDRAIDAAEALTPDVVIIDVTPGQERGLEIARRIHSTSGLVVLTSSAPCSSFQPHLGDLPFVAKGDLCGAAILEAAGARQDNRKGEPMNSSTTRTDPVGLPLWFLHNLAIIHAASDDTAGSYAVVELTGPAGDIPPLHVHHNDDEGFFLLDGAMRLHIGNEPVVHVRAGEFVLAPRGVPHVYVVESHEPARWLTVSNGGFDRFVAEVGRPASEPGLPSEPHIPPPEELTAIASRHGIEILAPPGTLPEQA